MREFAKRVIRLRQTEPVFRRRDFLAGELTNGSGLPDVIWLRPGGERMDEEEWERDDARALGVFLNGQEIPTHDRDGNPIEGASFLILFNALCEPITFVIPGELWGEWGMEFSTEGHDLTGTFSAGTR